MKQVYHVFRNKRVMFKGYEFKSYDSARQCLRKHIRQRVNNGSFNKDQFGMWDEISRNPTYITGMGYSIKRVACPVVPIAAKLIDEELCPF